MRLEITGKIDAGNLDQIVGKALEAWFDKLGKDNPAITEALEDADVLASAITIDFLLKPEGEEEWQVITTDNHEGIPELLVVKAETDEEGNLLLESVKDNDGESEFNEIEALIAAGVPSDRKSVVTIYEDAELIHHELFDFGDICINILTDSDGQVVVQATEVNWQGDHRLIAETVFDAEQLENIIEHYRELKEATE
ncbi:hypothetical protein [Enterococcus gallinarum]|uniref:hypothetical protein n=1 Tax=Enterococcus gallinarum TaxID=1353 RepID=UPI001AD61115|nr:hypothetical protein [Enterococcus gallinarum]MBO6417366.1 hypothetical protein [Enterococcus gallinarum]MBO6423389.1 hypothetical protein [Enterococcus gallinarum]